MPNDLTLVLNEDLGREMTAIAAYTVFAGSIKGLHREALAEMFAEEAGEELQHAQFFANKISALGGSASVEIADFSATEDPKEALDILLQMEMETVEAYTEHVEMARAAGEIGLAIDLEQILAQETLHKESIMKLLG